MSDLKSKLVNMLQRPPVEILTAEENHFLVHDKILCVLHSACLPAEAGQFAKINETRDDVLLFAEPLDCLGICLLHARIRDETHTDASRRRLFDCPDHLFQRFPLLV